MGGSGVCDLLEDAGDDTQGTRNPPVLGEVAEGREQRAQEAMTGTVPTGGGGKEVVGSWGRNIRDQGWLRLISSCVNQPLLSRILFPHSTPH